MNQVKNNSALIDGFKPFTTDMLRLYDKHSFCIIVKFWHVEHVSRNADVAAILYINSNAFDGISFELEKKTDYCSTAIKPTKNSSILLFFSEVFRALSSERLTSKSPNKNYFPGNNSFTKRNGTGFFRSEVFYCEEHCTLNCLKKTKENLPSKITVSDLFGY